MTESSFWRTMLKRWGKRWGRTEADRRCRRPNRRRFLRVETLEERRVLATLNAAFAGGTLTVTDAEGNADNALTLFKNGADFVIDGGGATFNSDAGGGWVRANSNQWLVKPASLSGTVSINFVGLDGNDSLLVNYANGDPTPGLMNFEGGAGSDKLMMNASPASSLYIPDSVNVGDGTIVVGSKPTSFTSLGPIDYVGAPGGSFELRPLNANDVISIEDGLLSNGSGAALRLNGTSGGVSFAEVRLRNAGLTINTTAEPGTDTITFNTNGASAHGAGPLSVNAGTEAGDVIDVNSTLTVTGTTTLNAKTINLNADVSNAVAGTTATVVNVSSPGQIQDGVAVAGSGATIRVTAGAYTGDVTTSAGTTLAGSFTLMGNLAVNGTLSPGFSPGIMSVSGNLSLNAGSTLAAEINSPYDTPGADFDQVQVGGSVVIASTATLSLTGTGPAPSGDRLLSIIDVTGSGTVSGVFSSRAQGSAVNVGGFTGVINYAGESGNDVALETLGTFSIVADPPASADEGNSPATSNRSFTITRTGGTNAAGAAPILVAYQTADGTAIAGSDYVGVGLTTLSFTAAGSRSQSVAVVVNGDDTVERDETFSVNLSSNSAGSFIAGGSSSALATITSDDTATFTIEDRTVNEGDGTVTFTVSLSNPIDVLTKVNVSFANVTTAAGDFDHTTKQVTFPANSTLAQSFTVTIRDDLANEGAETFTAALALDPSTPLVGYPTNLTDTAIGTLADNDVAGARVFNLPAADNYTVRRSGGNIEIVRDGAPPTLLTSEPVGAFSLTINGTAGNDSLTVSLTGGDAVPSGGLSFHGGSQVSTPGDSLRIVGGNQGNVTYDYTSPNDGTVDLQNFGLITYTGLEPLTNTGTAANVVFNLPATLNNVVLEDDGAINGRTRLRSANGTFETTDFASPIGTVTIKSGTASDTISVSSLPDFKAGLTVGDASNPFSTITFSGAITLAANRNLSATSSGPITLSAANSDLATNGSGSVALDAGTSIQLTSGSSVTTANGAISFAANALGVGAGNFIGVDIDGGTVKSSGAAVTIQGRGGTTGSGNDGISISGSGTTISAQAGLRLTGIAGGGPGSLALRVADASIADGMVVSLEGNSISLSGSTVGAPLVSISPSTAGIDIDLGSTTDAAANTLELSDAELDQITATAIQIGDSTQFNGAITVSLPVSVTPDLSLVWLAGTDRTLNVNGSPSTAGTFTATNLDIANLNADIAATSISGDATIVTVDDAPSGQIQDGIDIAASGATVNIRAGSYIGGIDATAKAITFVPGASPGQVVVSGGLVLTNDDVLVLEILGTSAATEFDNFVITGGVTLGDAQLQLSRGAFDPFPGQSFTIIDNDLIDAVSGTFFGRPEGSVILVAGYPFTITYAGGTNNNDVVLSIVQPNATYVNDDWVEFSNTSGGVVGTVEVGDTVQDGAPFRIFGYDAFAVIQDGIDAVAALGTVNVRAGTYSGEVTVNKEVTLLGANAGIAGYDTRLAESIISASAFAPALIEVGANGVTIDGFTIDGNELTSPLDVMRGIRVNEANDAAIVNNVVTQTVRGVQFNGDVSTANTGGVASDNLITDLTVHADGSYGVLSFNSSYVSVQDNVLSDLDVGIFEQYFYLPNGALNLSNVISGNDITAALLGYGTNERGDAAAVTELTGNTYNITGGAGSTGVQLYNIFKSGGITLTDETITGGDVGVYAFINGGSASIDGGSIAGSGTYGVWLTNYLQDFAAAATASGSLNISGAAISGLATGVFVEGHALSAAAVVANVTGNTEIDSAGTAVLASGPAASATITGNHIFDNTTGIRFTDGGSGFVAGNDFDGPADDNGTDLVIDLTAGSVAIGPGNAFAGDSLFIDNQSTTSYDLSANGTTFDESNNFRIEDKIHHRVDTDLPVSTGLVTWVASNLYVTTPGGLSTDSSIQRGIDAAASGNTVNVESGIFQEDLTANKTGLTLLGAGPASTTVSGPIGGGTSTIAVAASNVTIAGFTITRDGNAAATWNDPLNLAGISVQGQAITGMLVRDNLITENRTGIDVNNSSGHTIRNNVITDNHTGLIFRNQTDNLTVVENSIVENRTVGIVFLDASGGTNVPVQTAINSTFSNNGISGNWYGQIVDRQSGGSLPAPGTNLKNISGNWFGTDAPVITTANSAEPGYAVLIPVEFGGTAVAPGGQPDIAGLASANFDITPFLGAGTDTNVETAPGRGTFGFQGSFANLFVTSQLAQVGSVGRIQEGIDLVTSGGTVNILAGSYSGGADAVSGGKDVNLSPGASPGQVTLDGNLALNTGDTLTVEINGTAAATDYDNFVVTGMVALGGAVLALSTTNAFAVNPNVLQSYTIIENDGSADLVSGIFAGLPEGTPIIVPTLGTVYLTYRGGDGNDVVLNSQPIVNGTNGNDTFILTGDGNTFTLTINGGAPLVYLNPPNITINGQDGNDTLTIDLTGGDAVPAGGVVFNGGQPTASPGDSLNIVGGNQGDVTYNFTNASDGSIVMSNFGTVNYTGLEPVTNSGDVTNVTFNLPLSSDIATLSDNGATPVDNLLRLSSSPVSFERIDFALPTNSLTINLGAGSDSLTISAAPQLTAGLTVNGGAGDDTVNINADITFAAGKHLDLDLQNDAGIGDIDAVTIGSNANLLLSGSGVATVNVSKNISLASGSSVVTASGSITLQANQQSAATSGNFIGVTIDNAVVTSAGGDVTIAGRGSNDFGIAVSGSSVVSTSGGSMLMLTADSMDFAAAVTIDSGAGVTVLAPQTVGTAIRLGGADVVSSGPLALGLTDAELDRVIAGTINIGNTNSGPITISAPINRAAATHLSLTTGAGNNIGFSGAGSLDSAGGNISLTTSGVGAIVSGAEATDIAAGAGTISLNSGSVGIGGSGNALALAGANLNSTTTGNGNQFLSATGTIAIGAVGLAAGAGVIELAGGTFALGGSERISDPSDVVVSGSSTLALSGNNETIDQLVLVNGSVTGPGMLTATSTFDVRIGTISANLAGNVGLAKTTAGVVVLGGTNTYSGGSLFNEGTLDVQNDAALGTGLFTIDNVGAGVTLQSSNGPRVLANPVLLSSDITVAGANHITLGSAINGIDLDGAVRAINVTSAAVTFTLDGVVSSGGLTKDGPGTLALTRVNTYTAATTINAGKLLVLGSTHPASNVAVNSTGTLGGTGTVGGSVVVNAGGTITGGDLGTVGTLAVGSLSFNGGTLAVDIAGNTSDTIATAGAINLANAAQGIFSLNSQAGATDASTVFVLINNTAAGAIASPPLAGAAEGGLTTINGQPGRFTYAGGLGGNDFTLTIDGAVMRTINGSARLRRFVDLGAGIDNLQLVENGTIVDSRPTGSVIGSYSVSGGAGDDTLTIDYGFGGYFSIPVNFHGSGQAANGDKLEIVGASFDSIESNYLNANDGNLVLDPTGAAANTTITYTGLEPILLNTTVADLVFNLPAAANAATLQDDGNALNNLSLLAGATFEDTTFANPTSSLTIHRGSASDTLTINNPVNFTAGLTVGTMALPLATITVNSGLTLNSGTAALDLHAASINLNGTGPISTMAAQTYDGNVVLGASKTLTSTAGGNISFLGTVNGGFDLTVNTAGIANFGQSVGNLVGGELASLFVSGSANINASEITTTGSQTYTGSVMLIGTLSTLESIAGGHLQFGSTVNGGASLVTITGGNTTFSDAIGGITALTSLDVTTANLTATAIRTASGVTIENADAASVISGAITETTTATFTKQGTGMLALSGDSTYTGATTLDAGTLLINGSITSNVTVNSTGILGGTGTVTGSVSVNGGGSVSPGVSPGILSTGSVSFVAGASFNVEINGAVAGDDYDQLNMNDAGGTVTLAGAMLSLSGTFAVTVSPLQAFTIIDNEGAALVGGTFAGLPEGSPINVSAGGTLYITYRGGDGNDVVLNSQPIVNGTDGGDTFRLTGNGTIFTLTINGGTPVVYTNPPNFTINGLGGDDTMIVDYALGDALPAGISDFSLRFNGGGDSDTLAIASPATAQSAVYAPSSTTFGDGQIVMNGTKTIDFTSLSPIDYNVAGGSFTLNTPNAGNVVQISDGFLAGGISAALVVSGASGGVNFEEARVRGSSLTVNTTAMPGDDTITITSASGPHLVTALTVAAGNQFDDVINVNGLVNTSGTTTLNASTINLEADISDPVVGNTASIVNVNFALAPKTGQIQDGIDVAANGATVFVAPTTYAESPTINRPLILSGPNSGNSNFGSRDPEAIITGTVTLGSAGAIEIDGFTINQGIAAAPANGASVVVQFNIVNSSTHAVDISGTATAAILDNFISSDGDGIHGMTVAGGVTILRNLINDADNGIWLSGVGGTLLIGGASPADGNRINITAAGGIVVENHGAAVSATIQNNIINVAQTTGVEYSGGAADLVIRQNEITTSDSTAVSIASATGGSVLVQDNLITVLSLTSGMGVAAANVVGNLSVLGNEISSAGDGVNATLVQGDLVISDNLIGVTAAARDIYASDIAGDVTIQNNDLLGFSAASGVELLNVATDPGKAVTIGGADMLVHGNRISGPANGIKVGDAPSLFIENNEFLSDTAVGIHVYTASLALAASIAGNPITSEPLGIGILLEGSPGNLATVTLGPGNEIGGGDVGIQVNGPDVSLVGSTISDVKFSSQAKQYVKLMGGALFGLEIDGMQAEYDNIIGNAASTAEAYAIEDKIIHAIDDAAQGFVRVKTGQVFVTPASFVGPATTVANIQRAVNEAISGDTVNIQAGGFAGDVDTTALGKNLTLSPGESPAQVVNNGNLTLDSNDTLLIELDGTDPATDYDNFVITGTVTLGGAVLSPTISFSPTTDPTPDRFTLIDNDDSDAVVGQFFGIDEGEVITIGGATFQVTYQGGAGPGFNDVVQTAINAATPTLEGTPGDDTFRVVRDEIAPIDPANLNVFLNGLLIWETTFASLSSLTFKGLGGNDELIVDLSGGDVVPGGVGGGGITFDGDGPIVAPGDKLTITGGSDQGTTTYSFTSASSGAVSMTNFGDVNYQEIEPITNSGITTSMIVNLPVAGGPSFVNFSDDGLAANGLSRLDADTIESIDFTNPLSSLTIHRGNIGDTLTIDGPTEFTSALTVGMTAQPLATIKVNSGLNLTAPTAGLDWQALAIQLNSPDAITTTNSQSYGGAIQLSADVSLISLSAPGGTIDFAGTGIGLGSVPSSINADDSGTADRTLSITVGGSVNFGGTIGTAVNGALADLDILAMTGSINLNGAAIQVDDDDSPAATVVFDGEVLLGTSVSIDTDKAAGVDNSVTFTGTVNGDHSLSVASGAGTATFGGTIGTTTPLTDLDVSAATINLAANINTDGGTLTFLGNTILTAGSITIDTEGSDNSNAGSVTFGGGSISAAPTGASLTINTATGAANISGPVSLAAVASSISHLSIDASNPNTTSAADKFNAGDITFAGPVSLASDGNLSAAGGTIALTSATSDLAAAGNGVVSLTATQNILLGTGSSLATADGAIALQANRQAAPALGNFSGVSLLAGSSIQSTGSGAVTISGKSGNAPANFGVQVFGAVSTGGANLQLTGTTRGGPGSVGLQLESTGSLATPAAGGNITLIADSMNIVGSVTANQAASTVFLRQETAGTTINLGGVDVIGALPLVLGLTDAELDQVFSDNINIGDPNTGELIVSDAISRSAATNLVLTTGADSSLTFLGASGSLDANGGDVTISLQSAGAGAVVSGDALIDIFADDLTITTGSGGIGGSGNSLTMDVATLATNSANASGPQFLSELNSLTIADDDLDAGSATITLSGGTFLTTATGSILSDTIVGSGATLAGSGAVTGSVTVQAGGRVSPGVSTAILSTGSVAFNTGASFDVEVNGLVAGDDYDQLNVTGSVTLTNPTPNVTGSFSVNPNVLETFVVINNDDTDLVTGIFDGLPEGAPVAFGLTTLYISYRGGDGNDVVLNTQPIVNGTDGNDNFVLRGDGLEFTLEVYDDSPTPLLVYTNTYTSPPNLTINGLAGSDTLTVDFVNGQAIPTGGVFYNGGTQTAAPGDRLRVVGTGNETAIYTPNGVEDMSLDNDGTVEVDGRDIHFTTLEPIDIESMENVTLLFPNAADTITLQDGETFVNDGDLVAGDDDAIRVSGSSGSTTFETVALRNNTNVTIDTTTSDGADIVTLHSASNDHGNENLTIVTGGLGDMVDINGSVVFIGDISITSQQIDFNNPTSVLDSSTLVTLSATAGTVFDGDVNSASIVAPTLNASATAGITLGTNVGDLTATTSSGGAAISVTEFDAVSLANIATNDGSITVNAGGTVTAANVNAGTSDVTITVTGGALLGDVADPGVADVVGSTVTLGVTGAGRDIGVSAADRLEIDAVTLSASSGGLTGEDIFIDDRAGGLAAGLINAGAGVVDLNIEFGSLTSAAVDASADITAASIILSVTEAGSTIGASPTAPVEIDATTLLTATTADGDVVLADVVGDLPLGLVNSDAGIVDLAVTAGAITDVNAAANNITASTAALRAASGIGSTDSLETNISTLAASNTVSGDVRIDQSTGNLLTIGTVNGLAGVSNSAPAGQVVVTNASPLAVAASVIAGGDITLTAGETAASNDDLSVDAAVSVESTGGSVVLQAGDNFSLAAGSRVAAATDIQVTSLDTAADAAGSQFDVFADFDAVQAELNGAGENDTFNVRPDQDTGDLLTPIAVHGAAPAVIPGDSLLLEITGLGIPTLTLGAADRSGTWSFAGLAATVTYDEIETVSTTPATAYNLVLDMGVAGFENAAADTITVSLDSADLVLGVNGIEKFRGSAATIHSLTVIGSSDDDQFVLNETPAGLPDFQGQAPSGIDNTASGGGSSNGSHLNATAAALVVDVSNVTIHFDGGLGNNNLAANLTTAHTVQYTSDSLDSANSGNIAVLDEPGATLQTALSFANLRPISLTAAAGGSLIVDASSTAATASMMIDDGPGIGVSQVLGDGGVETTTFSGFTSLLVRSGPGADTIELVSLDSATLTSVTLDADNLAGTDTAADTIRVRSTGNSAATVTLLGGQGNDVVQVSSASQSIDGLIGQILVSPIGLDDPALTDIDSLQISDLLDADLDLVSVTESQIEGLTGYVGVGPDISYANIDTLSVTGTTFHDVFDVLLNSGSDLDAVTVSGNDGNDQFFLDLNTGNETDNDVFGLTSVTLSGDLGDDTFGNTPTNLPPTSPPIPLVAPAYDVPTFPGSARGAIQHSTTTAIVIGGGSATGDRLNLDFTPSHSNPDATAVLGTLGGTALTTGYQNLSYTGIDVISVIDNSLFTRVLMGDIFVRGTDNPDTIQFGATAMLNVASVNVNSTPANLLMAAGGKTVVYGRGLNDTIQQGSLTKVAEFYGGGGDDYLSGNSAADLLVGGLGLDRLIGNAGNNELWGDNVGEQHLDIGGADNISATTGADKIYGGGGNDAVSAGSGNDYVFGGFGDDTIDGGAGNDRLYGGFGNDTITGFSGNDLLAGNEGDDRLYGQTGLDVLIGGLGADYMTGDSDNDLLFDGSVTYDGPSGPVGTDASTAFGDVSDLAMTDLLADWTADSLINLQLLSSLHDAFIDSISGGLGNDTASKGPGDTSDAENNIL